MDAIGVKRMAQGRECSFLGKMRSSCMFRDSIRLTPPTTKISTNLSGKSMKLQLKYRKYETTRRAPPPARWVHLMPGWGRRCSTKMTFWNFSLYNKTMGLAKTWLKVANMPRRRWSQSVPIGDSEYSTKYLNREKLRMDIIMEIKSADSFWMGK